MTIETLFISLVAAAVAFAVGDLRRDRRRTLAARDADKARQECDRLRHRLAVAESRYGEQVGRN